MGTTVRQLLDGYSTRLGNDQLQKAEVVEALKPLKRVDWSLHEPPWRDLLLVKVVNRSGGESWGMRSEERTQALTVAREVLEFIVGITTLDENGQEELQRLWMSKLLPVPADDVAGQSWQKIVEQAMSE